MSPGSQTPPLKVLHVDDDAVNLMVMDHVLASIGHRPQGAATVAEALARLATEAFDVVLTDIHMPDEGGVELLQQLQDSRHADLPVIVVTADVMTRTAEDYRSLGFAGALAKPVLIDGLEQALAEASRPPAARRFASRGLAHG